MCDVFFKTLGLWNWIGIDQHSAHQDFDMNFAI